MSLQIKFGEQIISSNIRKADNFWTRLVGYMFTALPKDDDGIMFYVGASNSIHTCFMRFNLDLIFLRPNGEVVKIYRNLKPWRFTKMYPSAKLVLEVPAGKVPLELKEGDRLEVLDV
jgi:uncharacterized protein